MGPSHVAAVTLFQTNKKERVKKKRNHAEPTRNNGTGPPGNIGNHPEPIKAGRVACLSLHMTPGPEVMRAT